MSIIQNLIDFRDKQAEREGIENYKVLQYKTIEEIASRAPTTLSELEQIKGIGPAKLKKYGKQILQMVAEFLNTNSATSNSQKNSNYNPQKLQTENFSPDNHQKTTVRRQNAEADQPSPLDTAPGRGERIEKQVVRVGEYLEYLNLILAKTADVKIQGEITQLKTYPSGVYFSLQDKIDESVLGCFLPTFTYKGLGLLMAEGMEVAVEGLPRLVKRNGRFQFTVENLELVGEGALKKAYELLKQKLAEEGLFERKRELPEFIESIGVITSKSGAVIHDLRNNLPKLGLKIYLKDVRVEGASSSRMIIDAVRLFNSVHVIQDLDLETKEYKLQKDGLQIKSGNTDGKEGVKEKETGTSKGEKGRDIPKVDVLVIMRGGGSLEDMQAFNSEQVVRSIFASKIPTIVAIGHDQDVPLAQLVADSMVSTPTAAAKLIEQSWQKAFLSLNLAQPRLLYSTESIFTATHAKLELANSDLLRFWNRIVVKFNQLPERFKIILDHFQSYIHTASQGLPQKTSLLFYSQNQLLLNLKTKLRHATTILTQFSPENQLRLGYSILRNQNGNVIKSIHDLKPLDLFEAQVKDGAITAEAKYVSEDKK